jgi:NAD(P)H-hydrate repair Nnr-like enzyme with NAD(P)H-hydrate epimerase domain
MAVTQLERARKLGVKEVDTLADAQIVVDAMIGAGLNKPLNENIEHLVHQLNSFKGFKIACDIPTGVSKNPVPKPCFFV